MNDLSQRGARNSNQVNSQVRETRTTLGRDPTESDIYAELTGGRLRPSNPPSALPVRISGSANETHYKGRQLEFTCLKDVEPKPVTWLWEGRIAGGKLVLFHGEPDGGKTTVAIDLAARITNGEAWPNGEGHAPLGSVVVLTAEDGLSDTIRPRAEAAGADLSRMYVVTAALGQDGNLSMFSLQADLALLGNKLKSLGDVKLIIIDPLTAYMGAGKIDTHKTSDVRAILTPVAEFAEKHDVTVLGITHPPKATPSKAMHAATGSLAFIAAARQSYLFTREPKSDRRLMLAVKNNLGPPKDGLAYTIVEKRISKNILTSRIQWDTAPVKVSADEALTAEAGRSGDQSATNDAIDFLRKILKRTMPVAELEREAREAGLLKDGEKIGQSKPFRSARKKLGITTEKLDMDKGWGWNMPTAGDEHAH